VVSVTLLAPDIVAAILDDQLPQGISLFDLAVDVTPRLGAKVVGRTSPALRSGKARYSMPDMSTLSKGRAVDRHGSHMESRTADSGFVNTTHRSSGFTQEKQSHHKPSEVTDFS